MIEDRDLLSVTPRDHRGSIRPNVCCSYLGNAGKAPRRAESGHSARRLKIIFRFPSTCCGLLPRAAALFPQAVVGGQFGE